jgi:hypothetical protein
LPAASKLKETDAGIPSICVDSTNSFGWLPFGVVTQTGASCRHGLPAACRHDLRFAQSPLGIGPPGVCRTGQQHRERGGNETNNGTQGRTPRLPASCPPDVWPASLSWLNSAVAGYQY